MPLLRLRHGDCLDHLSALPDGSVEAIVCDPPYGLSLASWDTVIPTSWLPHAFRVLRPGGVLKAFSGTRTFHRLASEMSTVGFERVTVEAWGHSQGFPKGGDLARQVDREVEHGEATRERVLRVTRWIASRLRDLGLPHRTLDEVCGVVGMSSHWATVASQPEIPTPDHWPAVVRLLGEPPPDVMEVVKAWHETHPVRESRSGDERLFESYGRSTNGEPSRYVPTTPEGSTWSGWSTTLRPAWEPVVVGVKPYGVVGAAEAAPTPGTPAGSADAA